MPFLLLNEIKSLAPITHEVFRNLPLGQEAEIDVSLIIPAKNAADTLASTVAEADRFLNTRYPNSYEIILIPNPSVGDSKDQSIRVSEELARKNLNVRVFVHSSPRGKGAAIRTGIFQARGRWIFLTDSDLPYSLEFFDNAAAQLKSGHDLVNGNRRFPASKFHVPVHVLPMAYSRHRLGLGFNRLVRFLFPIPTTDTQAGIKALSRRLAQKAVQAQTCPGFLYDLELFLTAQAQGFTQVELPVTLYLNSEKSTVRVLRECFLVGNWLIKLFVNHHFKKKYGSGSMKKKKILTRYRNASFLTKIFLYLRWKLTPYEKIAAYLPHEGFILDMGCGHGLFSLATALNSPRRRILGIDHDHARIELGVQATQDIDTIELRTGSMTQPPAPSKANSAYAGIAMIDVLHYFDSQTQEKIVKNAFGLLEKGGTLLVREVDPDSGFVSKWNRTYEKLATWIGLTQSEKKTELFFRTRPHWELLMKEAGFDVHSERCSSFLFADILYICHRPIQ